MATLHIGTKNVKALRDLFGRQGLRIFAEGDHWENWGEPLPSEDAAMHVTVSADQGVLMPTLTFIAHADESLLEPLPNYGQSDPIAIITADGDWTNIFSTVFAVPKPQPTPGSLTRQTMAGSLQS